MLRQVHTLLAVVTILEYYVLIWDYKSGGMRHILCHFIELFAPASASINDATIRFVRRLSGHDVGTRTVTRIGEASFFQLLEIVLVDVPALALPHNLAVPRQSEPLQVVHQLQGKVPTRAIWVDILDAQTPLSTLALGRKPREECTKHVAQMHSTSWGRSKTTCHIRRLFLRRKRQGGAGIQLLRHRECHRSGRRPCPAYLSCATLHTPIRPHLSRT